MSNRNVELNTLLEEGWTRQDFMELFEQLLDKVFDAEDCFNNERQTRYSLQELILDLGFSLEYKGTQYIITALYYYIERGSAHVHLKNSLYPRLEHIHNVKYHTLRCSIRMAISKAFKNPTILAREIFYSSIDKRGYPTIKEFLTGTFQYIQLIHLKVD